MKWKNMLLCLLACVLLGLTACSASEPEPVFSHLDTAQITSGEVHNWSSAYWAEMTREDVERIGPLLQEVEGTPLPNAQPGLITGGTPAVRLTLSDGSQLTADLHGFHGIDLIVTTPEGESCYDVEQEQLDSILEIIQSYDPPELPMTP